MEKMSNFDILWSFQDKSVEQRLRFIIAEVVVVVITQFSLHDECLASIKKPIFNACNLTHKGCFVNVQQKSVLINVLR